MNDLVAVAIVERAKELVRVLFDVERDEAVRVLLEVMQNAALHVLEYLQRPWVSVCESDGKSRVRYICTLPETRKGRTQWTAAGPNQVQLALASEDLEQVDYIVVAQLLRITFQKRADEKEINAIRRVIDDYVEK